MGSTKKRTRAMRNVAKILGIVCAVPICLFLAIMGGPVCAVVLILIATISAYMITRRVGQAAKVFSIACAIVVSANLLIMGKLAWLILLILFATISTLIVTRRVGQTAKLLGITLAIVVGACLAFWGVFRLMIYTNGVKEPDVTSPNGKHVAFVKTYGFLDSSISYIYLGEPGRRAHPVLEMYHPLHNAQWSPDSTMVGAIGLPYTDSSSIYVYNARNAHSYSGTDTPTELKFKPDDRPRLKWRWKDPRTIVVYIDDGEQGKPVCSFSVKDTRKGVAVRRLQELNEIPVPK
jgi:hypothetical protein